MIDWIRISRRIASDTKTLAIADALNIPVAQAVGHLVALFAAMAEEATDGKIGDQPNLVLERWAAWEGKRGKLAPLLRQLLLTPDGVVAAWEKYNGAAIRKAGNDAERQRRHREKLREESASRHADGSRDSHVTSRGDGDGDGDVDGKELAPDGDLLAIPRADAEPASSSAVPSAAQPPLPSTPPAVEHLFARAYGRATPERQADVRMQLLATLGPRGARIARGEFAKAVDVAHLAEACAYVHQQLQRGEISNPDIAVVLVLRRVRETWPEVNAKRGPDAPPPPDRKPPRHPPGPLGPPSSPAPLPKKPGPTGLGDVVGSVFPQGG